MPLPSAYLDELQLGLLDARATATFNSMATGLNTPSASHNVRTFLLAAGNVTSPAAVDSTIDWRDRIVEYNLDFDPTRDIRWGQGSDGLQPMYSFRGSFYSRTGGVTAKIMPAAADLSLFVDTSGNLFVNKQTTTFVRGWIHAHPQGKDRS